MLLVVDAITSQTRLQCRIYGRRPGLVGSKVIAVRLFQRNRQEAASIRPCKREYDRECF